ncbi:DNA internalization-related competence protein ComEC/Rec2 [Paucilactobacillus sp. N302-9]
MQRFWIFPALGCGIVAGIIYGQHYFLFWLLGWLVVRVVSLRKRGPLLSTMIVVVIFGGWCLYQQSIDRTQKITQEQKGQFKLLVYPDQIKVNGNQFQMIAKNLSNNENMQVFGEIKTRAEKEQLGQIDQTFIWQIKGVQQPILPATNVNQFDPQMYLKLHHINAQLIAQQHEKISIENVSLSQQGLIWCHNIRKNLINYFDTMPKTLRMYCNSLILGNSVSDFGQTMIGVRQLGLVHLFCISGMHVVLLVSLIRKGLIYCRLNIETINVCLMIVLPSYLIVGGNSPSLVRATMMSELLLLGQLFQKRISALDIWSLSLLVGLIYQPTVLMTLGGQLSYLLSLMLHFLPEKGRPFVNAILMNLLGLPSILYFVFEWHCLSLVASYLMIPFFSSFIFPGVLITSILFKWYPIIGQIVDQFLVMFQSLIDTVSRLPGMVHFGKPTMILSFSLFFLTLLLVTNFAKRKYWLLLIGAYCIVFVSIHFPITGEVNFLDIGQGDSFLIVQPFHRNVTLIDTGGQLSFPQKKWQKRIQINDKASKVTINYLKSKGISRIDTICLSHADVDHIGFSPTILNAMKVRQIIFPAGMQHQPNFKQKVLPFAQQQRIALVPVIANQKINHLPLMILHPFKSGQGKNEDSMVLFGSFGQQRFLFTGDLHRAGERQVLKQYPELRADVLKLGHHGSKTSSDPQFIHTISPQLAIISAGRRNRYGHPNEETLQTLKKQHIVSLSTQTRGMITYRFGSPFSPNHWQTKLKGDEVAWMSTPSLTK